MASFSTQFFKEFLGEHAPGPQTKIFAAPQQDCTRKITCSQKSSKSFGSTALSS